MAMNKADKLFKELQDMYGQDVIIVHDLYKASYFTTTSANKPAKTKEVLTKTLSKFS
jgi:hypothetical protein